MMAYKIEENYNDVGYIQIPDCSDISKELFDNTKDYVKSIGFNICAITFSKKHCDDIVKSIPEVDNLKDDVEFNQKIKEKLKELGIEEFELKTDEFTRIYFDS